MNEEELEQAIGALEMYKGNLEQLQQQKNFVELSLKEYVLAKSSLEAFENAEKGDEVMVPIGAGIMAKMNIADSNSFVVNAGSNISVEKDFKGALEIIESRMKDIEDGLNSINENIKRIEQEYEKLAHYVQHAYEEYQRSQNVQNP